jgi:hypothetical protein
LGKINETLSQNLKKQKDCGHGSSSRMPAWRTALDSIPNSEKKI